MKRSEMIAKMIDVIHELAALSPELVAKSILAMQTEAGMVPPDIQKCNCQYCSPKHEWEKED